MRKISETNLTIHVVSMSARFGHYVIDVLVFQTIFMLTSTFFQSIDMFNDEMFPFAIFPIQFLYYTLMEGTFGFTIGKLILGSIVVDEYGNQVDLSAAAYRSIVRYVPFEPFSMFSNTQRGWHDRWTKTYVIRRKDHPELIDQLNLADQE